MRAQELAPLIPKVREIPEIAKRPQPDESKSYRRPTTVDEAEEKHLIRDPRLGPTPVIFGFMHDEWLKFKSMLKPGDDLIEFYTAPALENMIHGYRGYEIVRKSKTIATLITST